MRDRSEHYTLAMIHRLAHFKFLQFCEILEDTSIGKLSCIRPVYFFDCEEVDFLDLLRYNDLYLNLRRLLRILALAFNKI